MEDESDFGKSVSGSSASIVPSSNGPEDEIWLRRGNNPLQPSQWAMVGSGMWKTQSKTDRKLVPGEYTIAIDGHDDRPVFIKKDSKTDDLITFEGGLADAIFREINNFWKKEKVFKKVGFLHRRGYLLYGPQGQGKSALVRQILNSVVKDGGVVFHCGSPTAFEKGLVAFRQVEPERPLVCVFEDIDAIIKRYGEEEILSILDGANQIDRVLNVATTNYPEYLDKRIVSRPRRFDRVYKIYPPDEKVRRKYLSLKLTVGHNIEEWIKATAGLSFAGLTEVVISVVCLGNDLKKTVEILKNLEKGQPSSEDFKDSTIGFGSDVGENG